MVPRKGRWLYCEWKEQKAIFEVEWSIALDYSAYLGSIIFFLAPQFL